MNKNSQYYKDNLYSRQVGVLGESCMKQINKLSVCLIHLDTTGFEIAKCLVLMGIKQLYIQDSRIPNASHIGLNISIIKDCTDTIATQTKKYLDTLNPFVEITIIHDKYYQQKIKTLPIQVCIQTNIDKYRYISDYCHVHSITYIFSYQYNLTGYIFNDFGTHSIYNLNGEKPLTSYVKKCYQYKNKITFELVESHFEHNTKIKCIHPPLNDIFTITKKFSESSNIIHIIITNDFSFDFTKVKNILIQEYKEPSTIQHESFKTYLDNKLYTPDVIGHMGSTKTPNVCIQSIHQLLKQYNLTRHIPTHYTFPIIGSILGSIIAQEVIKTTGMYTPINQQYIIDYSDLSKDISIDLCTDISKDLSTDLTDPYFHIHNILPNDIIEKLSHLKLFLVGCGALGCEYLKYFHQLDIASASDSNIVVTDMDHIELSNLNRQFLFKENNIGQSKSLVATQTIQEIHSNTTSDMHVQALDKELSKTSELYFNHAFWSSKDIIINALDNVHTRQYVDEKCVLYEKPLFESGTLGTKCNVQIIIPHKTITYSETQDPPQKDIPVCTIKNFPYLIDHCICWALELFNYHFNIIIHSLDTLCNNYSMFQDSINKISNINNKYKLVLHTFYLYDCMQSKVRVRDAAIIKYLIMLLHTNYITNILILQSKHPKDFRNGDGTYFWSGHKLYPTIIDSITHKQHIYKWVDILYNVLAHSIPGITPSKSTKEHHKLIDSYIQTLSSKEFTLETEVFKIIQKKKLYSNQENLQNSEYLEIKLPVLYDSIESLKHKKKHYKQIHTNIYPQTFDKDHLTNKHIDVITELANFRAINYGISCVSIPECRIIAGNIIPALSTTTTLVTALSIMELLKYLSTKHITHTDHFINTSINTYIQSTPMKATNISSGFNIMYGCHIITKPDTFTIWDKIIIHLQKNTNTTTIGRLIQILKQTYDISISILSIKDKIIYSKGDKLSSNQNDSILDTYPIHEYIPIDITEFQNNSLLVYPNIVLYYD